MNKIKVGAGVIATLAFVAQVSAGFVDLTDGFNVLTFGDFSDKNDQIHGAIAAAGEVNLNNNVGVNMDTPIDPSNYMRSAIVSGKNVNVSGNGEVRGAIYASGDVLIDNVTVAGNVQSNNIKVINYNVYGTMYYENSVEAPSWIKKEKMSLLPKSPVDFAAKKEVAEALSNELALLGSKDYSIESGVLTLTNDLNADVNYFSIDAAEIELVTDLYIDAPEKAFVLNVNGNGGALTLNHINQKKYGTSEDLNFSNILFNFINTESIEIGSIYGNVLAANTNVTAKEGQMFGSMVAQSFNGKYEFHQIVPGKFPPTNVPEASTTAMMLTGLLCLFVVSRKKISFFNS